MIENYNNFLKTINLTEAQFLKEINSYPVFYCYEDKGEELLVNYFDNLKQLLNEQ